MLNMTGFKKIYKLFQSDGISRYRFIRLVKELGLVAKYFKNYQRTTFITRSRWFINLNAGLSTKEIFRCELVILHCPE